MLILYYIDYYKRVIIIIDIVRQWKICILYENGSHKNDNEQN